MVGAKNHTAFSILATCDLVYSRKITLAHPLGFLPNSPVHSFDAISSYTDPCQLLCPS